MVRISILSLLLALVPALGIAQEWKTLKNCRLVDSFLNDGDSFLVTHQGKEYVFRLYFVDAPEVSRAFPERVKEQAEYFGITSTKAVAVGAAASDYTKKLLGRSFTVHTQWQDGWGKSKRFLALIEKDGLLLSEHLTKAGLARIHGFRPESTWPGGTSAGRMLEKLHRLERESKDKGLGGWGDAMISPPASAPPNRQEKPEPNEDAIDLNLAEKRALESLPGIGPTLAARIIDGRPWNDPSDLSIVRGIGGQTLQELQSLVKVTQVDSIPETANYYRNRRDRWLNHRVPISVVAVEEKGWPAPDGFIVLSAKTGARGQAGGAIPLFIPDDRLEQVREYFSSAEAKAIRTQAVFFDYQGNDVLVIPRAASE